MPSANLSSIWLDPETLISQTPSRVRPPVAIPMSLSATIVAAPGVILAEVLWPLWEPLALLAVVAIAISFAKCHAFLYRFIQNARISIPLEGLRRSLTTFEHAAQETVRVNGIRPGRWICLQADHEQARRNLRGSNARVPYEPKAKFRYCISRYKFDNVSYRIAFSNGDEITYYPTQNAYFHEHSLYESNLLDYDGSIARCEPAAKKLSYLLDLFTVSTSLTLRDLYRREMSGDVTAEYWRALRAACLWGLIGPAKTTSEADLYMALSREELPGDEALLLCITDAGRIWVRCNPLSLDAQERKARMEREQQRPLKVDISGGSNPGWNLGTVHGGMNNTTSGVSEEAVLKALAILVQTPGVPWESDEDRAAATRAVVQGEVDSNALKPIVSRVLALAQRIGFSLAEAGVLEVLKAFVGP